MVTSPRLYTVKPPRTMGKTGRPDESRGMVCTSRRDPSASFLFFDIFLGPEKRRFRTVSDDLSTQRRTKGPCFNQPPSSLPFSLPRSFLSFLGFLSSASSPVDADDMKLWVVVRPEGPEAPEDNATDGAGGSELEVGVGRMSPSGTDWYWSSVFNKNLTQKKIVGEGV